MNFLLVYGLKFIRFYRLVKFTPCGYIAQARDS